MWTDGILESSNTFPAPTVAFQEAQAGLQDIGFAQAEHVSGFQLITPDAVKSLFTTVFNYAKSYV